MITLNGYSSLLQTNNVVFTLGHSKCSEVIGDCSSANPIVPVKLACDDKMLQDIADKGYTFIPSHASEICTERRR